MQGTDIGGAIAPSIHVELSFRFSINLLEARERVQSSPPTYIGPRWLVHGQMRGARHRFVAMHFQTLILHSHDCAWRRKKLGKCCVDLDVAWPCLHQCHVETYQSSLHGIPFPLARPQGRISRSSPLRERGSPQRISATTVRALSREDGVRKRAISPSALICFSFGTAGPQVITLWWI